MRASVCLAADAQSIEEHGSGADSQSMSSSHSGPSDPNAWTCASGDGWDSQTGKRAGDENMAGRGGNGGGWHCCGCGGGGGGGGWHCCGGGEGAACEQKNVSQKEPRKRMKILPWRPRCCSLVTGVMPVVLLLPERKCYGGTCSLFAALFGLKGGRTGSMTHLPSPPFVRASWP